MARPIPSGRPDVKKTGNLSKRYARESLGTRCFLFLRWIWTPYEAVARCLPEKGRILDAGCGHGLLALALALQSPRRFVFGVDHDRARVLAARRASHGLPNLRFESGDYTRLPGGTYDGMVFMDVLHYLPFKTQESLFRRARRKLKKGGRLVFREVAAGDGFFSGWNKIHENLMTRLGFTQAEELHFRDAKGWRQLARKTGFRVSSKPFARPPFADHLFECEKR